MERDAGVQFSGGCLLVMSEEAAVGVVCKGDGMGDATGQRDDGVSKQERAC